MRKAFYLFVCGSFIAFNCIGQKNESNFSGAVLIGPSIPVGKFADKSVSKDTVLNLPGKANLGPALEIVLNYKVTKAFGLTLLAGGQLNKQNVKSMTDYFMQYAPSDNTIYKATTRNWKIGKILAGAFLKIPISHKFYFEPRLLAGGLKTSAPGYQDSFDEFINGSLVANGTQRIGDHPLPWAFCYQTDCDFSWHYNSKISFLMSINYSHASSESKFIRYTVLVPPPSNPKQYQTNYKMESVNVLAGVGFKF
jgi:hypothetical protein